jgi:cytochrome c oxidase subunit 2
MPIVIEAVPPEKFAAWVASKGGTMPGATPAVAPTGARPAVTPAAQPNPPTPSAADRATAND